MYFIRWYLTILYRLLKDLDEELLSELDSICHDNQMACFPISRGRNSDEYVFEKYPELVGLVERDKQRRIDSMKLQSRMDRVETRQTGNEKPGPPSKSKAKAKAGPLKEISDVARSPVLKSKHSTNDLMFEMDEEAVLSPGDSMKGKTPIRGSRQVDVTESPLLGSSLIEEESFGDRSFLDGQMASPQDTLLAESPSETRVGALQRKNGVSFTPDIGVPAPWRSPMAADKKDLRDIMAETSGTRVSNLSLGISKESRRESSSNASPKLSQKERKKLQQQQVQERLAAEQKAKEASQNPWKLPPAPANNPDPPLGMNREGSQSMKTPPRPAMTLRQTVAGTPPPPPKTAAPVQTQSHSVSANVLTPSPLKSSTASGPSTTPVPFAPSPRNNTQPQPPVIQSVRHIPRPEPYQTSFHTPSANSLSLAAILMQQQTEKDEIHEAATAKYNLQDIQAEQEFQEWWDQESRRVQGLPDLEQPESSSTAQEGKGTRGGRGKGSSRNNNNSSNKRRGGGGGGGGGRGKDGGAGGSEPRPASDASVLTQKLNQHRSDNNNRDKKQQTQQQQQQQQQQQSSHHPSSQPRGHGGNRGGGGGGGRGARGRGGKERARV